MVPQGPREDVVAQVEDQEADDEQWADAGPHDLPVPVQSAASHGLKVTFKSTWKTGRRSLDYPCCRGDGGLQPLPPICLGGACSGTTKV